MSLRTDTTKAARSLSTRRLAIALAIFTALIPVADTAWSRDGPARTVKPHGIPARAKKFMVSAANPLAVRAGLEILRAGGSAVDAVIATQMVLNLVEPQSSGIGGGAFMLHWDAAGAALTTYDGRERAPLAARPDRFMRPNGKRMRFRKAVRSGLSVGVPGLVRMLELAHKRHGKLAWARLFEPAIRLAREGFAVSRRLNLLLTWKGPSAFGQAARRLYFGSGGRARPVGSRLQNPAFADTLEKIAGKGADAFYQGPIADAIIARLARAPIAPGDMTRADLAAYRAIERPPVCAPYRGYKICGMGPPSSGGLTVAQVLALLEPFDLGRKPLGTRALHLIAEAEKLAYADRDRYMADSDFVSVPSAGLLDPKYLAGRRKLIDPDRTMGRAKPGRPPTKAGAIFGRDATRESSGTSHISIIDGAGNAVSMTTTIESAFGAQMMTGGFLLNNELTDFSMDPTDQAGRAIANRVEPGKRPRSSMAPTIIFTPDGRPWALLGSPGGTRIILYVVKAIVALIDWKLDAQAAAALENFGSRNGPFEFEIGWMAPKVSVQMALRRHKTRTRLMTSGLHIIVRRDGFYEGGADPRREGLALGD